MLKTLTKTYIITMVIVVMILVCMILFYYLFYNKEINRRITMMQKGKHLISPLSFTKIIVIIGLIVSSSCTYRYNQVYGKTYAKIVENSKGTFSTNTIERINLNKEYEVHHKETKYEKITYYVLKSHQFSFNERLPKVYVSFAPKQNFLTSYTTYQIREFKQRQNDFTIQAYKNNKNLSFTTKLTGTTLHLEIERILWKTPIVKGNDWIYLDAKVLKIASAREAVTLKVEV